MKSVAHANYVRYSPRKVGQVLDLVRKKSVIEAFKILKFCNKGARTFITKTLKSAVANIKRLNRQEGLVVSECYANCGPVLKRFRARAFGRAAPYKHRTCHLTIVVSDEQM